MILNSGGEPRIEWVARQQRWRCVTTEKSGPSGVSTSQTYPSIRVGLYALSERKRRAKAFRHTTLRSLFGTRNLNCREFNISAGCRAATGLHGDQLSMQTLAIQFPHQRKSVKRCSSMSELTNRNQVIASSANQSEQWTRESTAIHSTMPQARRKQIAIHPN